MTKKDQISIAKSTLMAFLLGDILPFRKPSEKNKPNLTLKRILNNGLNSTSWSAEKHETGDGFGHSLPKEDLNFCLFNKALSKWFRAIPVTARYFSRDSGNRSSTDSVWF